MASKITTSCIKTPPPGSFSDEKESPELPLIAKSQRTAFSIWKEYPPTGNQFRSSSVLKRATVLLGAKEKPPIVFHCRFEPAVPEVRFEGNYGEVLQQEDSLTGGFAAAKTNFTSHKKLIEATQNEYQALHKLRHVPHIVQVLGAEKTGDLTTIYLEWVGPDFNKVVLSEGPFSIDRVISVLRPLLEFQQGMEKRNWVHGDLKMLNILQDPKGGIKVCDFGFAHNHCEKQLNPNALQSLPFRSPEILIGCSGRYTSAIDRWSIGCIAYSLFRGEYLINAVIDGKEDVVSALMQMVQKAGPLPPQFRERIHPYYLGQIDSLVAVPFQDDIRRDAARLGFPKDKTELFIALLTGLLAYENRMECAQALALCDAISPCELDRVD